MPTKNQNIEILASTYLDIKKHIIKKGFGWEVDWQENQSLESLNESKFISEAAWVILSSGMSVHSVSSVFSKVSESFMNWDASSKIVCKGDKCINEALVHFNHKGKIGAIYSIIKHIHEIGFIQFKQNINNQGVKYFEKFNYFGPATSFHLAKNIGMNVVKPDRHLIRIANALNFSHPDALCKSIGNRIDEKVSVIDLVLWRYCVLNPNYLNMLQKYKFYS